MKRKNSIQAEISIHRRAIDALLYTKKKRNLVAEFKGLPNAHGVYEGEYDVIPTFNLQTLDTNGKLMTDDVSVYAIPVSEVENLAGGYTVYIGGEINYG